MYVGQELFAGTLHAPCDQLLPDPPQRPPHDHDPLGRPAPYQAPDAAPPIFTKLVVHSYYNNSVELREWVDTVVEPTLAK